MTLKIEIAEEIGDELKNCIISKEWKDICANFDLAELSDVVWVLRNNRGDPIFIIGVFQFSMVGLPPTLWLLLCEQFEERPIKYLREVRELINVPVNVYGRVEARVYKNNIEAQKFIGYLGFEAVRETDKEIVYRMEAI